MKLLLDTHAFLWFIAGSDRLSKRAEELVADGSNDAFLSVASLWEIAIKVALGKLVLATPFELLIPAQLQRNRINVLSIDLAHLTHLLTLPMHHRDPFDRLIVAQALEEELDVVGADKTFDRYGVVRHW